MNQRESKWAVVNEFGHSKTYVDLESVSRNGSIVRALVRYALNPPGTDRRNGKPISEMFMAEEYDLHSNQFRVHKIIFVYEDGSAGEPLFTDLEWNPATGGNEKTLGFLRSDSGGQ